MKISLKQSTALLLALVMCSAQAAETDALDLSFGQNGSVDINALTGASLAFCTTVAAQNVGVAAQRLLLGCNLDNVQTVLGLRHDGTLDPQFGTGGRAILPNLFFQRGGNIRGLLAQSEITLMQIQAADGGACGTKTLITRLDAQGQRIPGYGGLLMGARFFELEPFGSSYLGCSPSIGAESEGGITTMTLPIGETETRPAVVSLDDRGEMRNPFQPVRRLAGFSSISAISPVGQNTLIAGLNAQGVAQIAGFNPLGQIESSFGGGAGTIVLPAPGPADFNFPLMALATRPNGPPGPPDRLIAVSLFNEGTTSGLLVSALFFNGDRDLTFNASGALGATPGQALLPLSLLPGAQRIDFAYLLMDAQRQRMTLVVRINNFAGDAFALRLLADGQLDPDFRSGAQNGVVRLMRQNSEAILFAGAMIDGKLVYVDGHQPPFPFFQTTVSRLRGNQIIFANGFE